MSNYNVNWTSGGTQGITGKASIEIPADSYNTTSTSLTLTGKNVAAYGEIQQQNYIQLLESFASVTPPPNPTIGQLWYDATPVTHANPTGQTLYVCIGLQSSDVGNVPPSLIVQFANYPGYWVTVSNNSIPSAAVISALGGISPLDRAGTTGPTGAAGGTMTGPLILSGNPTSALGAATKQYVDAAVTGFSVKPNVQAATISSLTAAYNNGSAGVGATLTYTGSPLGSFGVDGYSAALNDRILVKNQTAALQNGVYVVTTLGSATTPWVLTRDPTYDGSTGHAIHAGDFFFISSGGQGGSGFIEQGVGTGASSDIVVGVDAITFTQFSGSATYRAGNGITLAGTTFSNAGVTSLVAGTNVALSGTTGAVTISVAGTVSSAVSATNAQNTVNVGVSLDTTDTTLYPLFALGTGGNFPALANSGITYNAAANRLTASTFNGNLTGTATNATQAVTTINIAGGSTGSLPYQTGAGSTTLLPPGTNGQVLYTISGNPAWGNLPAQTFGTVTSIALSAPSIFTVTGSPITSSGTIALSLNPQGSSTFLAAPAGASGTPTFRAIVPADIPTLNQNTTGNAATAGTAVTASTATIASTANALNTNAGVTTISYTGNAGQPTWLLGTNSGTNYQVWNPSNFSVAYATNAGTAAVSSSALGVGQSYGDYVSSRALNTAYTNSTGRPIFVNALIRSYSGSASAVGYVNGVAACTASATLNTSQGNVSFVVPNGASYSINNSGSIGIDHWYELR